ncbi:unnamed protein product [Amoebophrya sp. A25]|nr:unnamed protein product [Amoebophrya sp. A25]|eukprot:GSA25T00013764001.1
MPGGSAAENRVYLRAVGDTEGEHLAKCITKCSEYVVTGNEGCGGFVYEHEELPPSRAAEGKLVGKVGACVMRRGPVSMDPICPRLDGISFFRRMSAVVTVKPEDEDANAAP